MRELFPRLFIKTLNRGTKCNSPGEILWGSIRLRDNNAAARDRRRKIVQDDRAGDPSSAKVTNITTHMN